MGVRLGGVSLPDFDAEALLVLIQAAIDALPDTQKPKTEDDWVAHIELKPSADECYICLLWDWPPAPVVIP